MREDYVVNIFWSAGYTNGGKLFVLYSDYTWEVFRTKHDPNEWAKDDTHMTFKKFLNAKILRLQKYTKVQTHAYVTQKDLEFKSFNED